MEMVLHRAHTRGAFENEWLSTSYSFSFADWHDPKRMGFGALRVINDDSLAPASGFGMHPHRDMEIITIVTSGTLTHKDDMGNTGTVPAGEFQVMSAGTGVVHSEYNDSPDTSLTLFQIWITSARSGIEPRYAQKPIGLRDPASPGIIPLVVPDGTPQGLPIYQDAYISRLVIDEDHPFTYTLRSPNNGLYIFVVEGALMAAGESLERRDALGVWDADAVDLTAHGSAIALLIEVPMA
ncbi:MAG TPA: pirin family protein [Candidatus Paceibacterota bacterium]|jgi:hypothetical protein